MAGISLTTGVGSGIDIDSLVTQLIANEGKARSSRLDVREATFQSKLSAYGSFRSALDSLQNALAPLKDISKFQGRAVSVGDKELLSVTADAKIVPGSYDVEVERLATAQRQTSGPFAALDTVVGTGTLQFTVDGKAFSVVIGEDNNTLAGIRDSINQASDNSGVVASIVNETGFGFRLVLASAKTGAANTVAVAQTGGDAGLQALVGGLTETQVAQDSRIVVNGLAHESAGNTVTTAVDGLTFNLLKVSEPDVTTQVTVTNDKAGATRAVNDFVNAYNALMKGLKGLSSYNAATGAAGALLGDSTLRDFMFAVRRELGVPMTGISGSFSSLAELGIVSNVDGTLSVNATRLDTFLTSNFDQVGALFANDASATAPVNGLARRLDTLIQNYIGAGGLIQARTEGLENSIDVIDEQRETLNQRLATMEQRLRAQFIAMDSLVAQLNTTSNFLTQQLSTLNGSALNQRR